MEFITIAKILNTHGVKGELKVEVYTDFLEERFLKGSKVYIGEDHIEAIVKSYRMHNGFMLLLLKDLENINLVEKYKNNYIYKSSDDIEPLEDGYFFRDLKDADVYVDNILVGKSMYCEEGISSNYLRVKKIDNKEVLIPILDQFIEKIDVKNKRIDIVKMEGLL